MTLTAHSNRAPAFVRKGGPVVETRQDPVCGMQVVPEQAAAKWVYQGQTYYFCCPACMHKFEREPEKYLKKAPVAPHS